MGLMGLVANEPGPFPCPGAWASEAPGVVCCGVGAGSASPLVCWPALAR